LARINSVITLQTEKLDEGNSSVRARERMEQKANETDNIERKTRYMQIENIERCKGGGNFFWHLA
jgi:hypothetical protein